MKNKLNIIISLSSLLLILIIIVLVCYINSHKQDQLVNLHDGDLITFQLKKNDSTPINLEVARSELAREYGLMYRQNLNFNKGMIFIFDNESLQIFWMKNTLIPLDIIYLDKNLKVINFYLYTKINQTTEIYPSNYPSQYVIETSAGWAKTNDLKIGDYFEIK